MEAWTNDIIGVSERRLLIKNAILGFKSLSWELRKDKKFTNVSLLVIFYLKGKEAVLRADIMKALKCNYSDVDNALKLLKSHNYIIFDSSVEMRLNNRIAVKAKRYRLSLAGDIFAWDMVDYLLN